MSSSTRRAMGILSFGLAAICLIAGSVGVTQSAQLVMVAPSIPWIIAALVFIGAGFVPFVTKVK